MECVGAAEAWELGWDLSPLCSAEFDAQCLQKHCGWLSRHYTTRGEVDIVLKDQTTAVQNIGPYT